MPNIDSPSTQPSSRPVIDPIEALRVIWGKRKFIIFFVGIVTTISIVVSLILPSYYKSTATILPETQTSKLSSLGGLSDLAALAGVNVGGEASLVKLYPTIVKSESVLGEVIYAKYKTKEFADSVNLIQYWKLKETKPGAAFQAALKTLRDGLEVSMDLKTSVLTISFEAREPQLTADIINKIVDGLDRFILTKRTTSASEQRKFIEGRLEEVKGDLTRSEDALRDFREQNAQVRSPQLVLEQGRLERNLQINNTLFVELKKQFELAKIEEVKNVPIINVLDHARPAVERARPRRTSMVITTFVLAIMAAVDFVLMAQRYRLQAVEWLTRVKAIFV